MDEIRVCSKEDLKQVLDWLKAENAAGLPGCFYCNRSLIKESFKKKNVWILDLGKGPIAFLVLNPLCSSIEILEVKHAERGHGYGRKMAEFAISYFKSKNHSIIRIDCQPSSSINFWKKMGFHLYKETFKGVSKKNHYSNRAYLKIGKDNYVDPSWPMVSVEIRFYPEQVKWNDKSVEPIVVFKPDCFRKSSNELVLKDRIVFYHPSVFEARDVVICISVEDNKLYMDKAKYEEGKIFGINKQDNDLFWLDRILIP
ncbi:GNAT family N-acetyltransferase [Peredibacter starrii]|uniref:GNAT family N-acetyltransferase n=1 Tax=Peredibacter starrii TaxID=28202 RepID=A0AAX4HTJ3_9BACT|nr:GNAT family N-acetyltransferase [Peredibacter starrii]WPU66522.1 GNAT family N-acetyltransferase [Peredibacter starrii]